MIGGSSNTGSYAPLGQTASTDADDVSGNELLLQPEVAENTVAPAEPMIQVKAPATLPEGYQLDVQVGSRTYTVTIPPGGVQEGQSFQVPLPGGSHATDDFTNQTTTSAVARISVPTGQWRDGVCDCFNHGICHPMLWNSIFFHTIALGQVMTRLKLNLLANPIEQQHGARELAKFTFKVIFWWTVVAVGFNYVLFPFVIIPLNSHTEVEQVYDPFLKQTLVFERRVINDDALGFLTFLKHFGGLLHYSMLIATIVWATKTRAYIRQKYGIPARYCSSGSDIENLSSLETCHVEDCLCSTCCPCCTISQMARHTMEYDTYPGTCCTPTGVRDSVPDIV